MRTFSLVLTVLSVALAAAFVSACGKSESASGAAALAPAGSLLYGEATIDPEGDQEQQLRDLYAKFPGGKDVANALPNLLEKAFRDEGAEISFKKDIEPWLGEDAAGFLSSVDGADPSGAFMVATDDEDAAMDAVRKSEEGEKGDEKEASYKGHDYLVVDDGVAGTLDGWLVFGTEAGFKKAVDVSEGEDSLEDAESFEEATDEAPDDRLGLLFLDTQRLFREAGGSGAGQLGAGLPKDPVVVTLAADSDGAEATATMSAEGGFSLTGSSSELLDGVPEDSWVAVGLADAGKTLKKAVLSFADSIGGRDVIEQQLRSATGLGLDDVLDWMGDAALFARGSTVGGLNGALVVQTKDEAASGRVLDSLQRLARGSGEVDVGRLPFEGEGFSVRDPEIPQPIFMFQRDGRVVIAYSESAAKAALDPSGTLADSEPYRRAVDALGDGYDPSLFVAIGPILDLVDSTSARRSDDWREAERYLKPVESIIAGAKKDGDDVTSVLRVNVP
jgi:Protein of unknown function (DUF3352)